MRAVVGGKTIQNVMVGVQYDYDGRVLEPSAKLTLLAPT